MSDRRQLYSIYQRIKNNCCEQWWSNSKSFYEWYENQEKKQKGQCYYCQLPGDTNDKYGRHFRYGRRGLHLEVDRKEYDQSYSPRNCVLACYPCNNAKSDVFSHEEFLVIGLTIGKTKKQSTKSDNTP